MLFLVVSEPRPERPSEVAQTRQSFWPWIAGYRSKGVCKDIYARVGRGAAAIFDVQDHLELHRILNEWADIIPAEFAVYPLLGGSEATAHLAAQTGKSSSS
jgi:muconolactone delta-isomerase